MDEIHFLHRYGKYTFQDVLEMTGRERVALLDRTNASMKEETEAMEKAIKGS